MDEDIRSDRPPARPEPRFAPTRGAAGRCARTLVMRLALAFALVLGGASVGAAQPDSTATAEYQALISRAIAESSEGRWEEARAFFHQAQLTLPNARALRGIAMASYELRDYVDVVRSFTAALRSDVRPLTPEQRAEAEAIVARTEPLVGQYTTEAYPPEATFFVDGVPTALTVDRVLVVPLRRHEVEARWADERAYGAVEVQGGEREALALRTAPRLDPEAALRAARDAQLVGRDPEPMERDVPRERILARGGAWGIFAGGLAATMAGSVLLAVGRGEAATVEDAEFRTSWSSLADTYDHSITRTRAGFGLLAIGVATAGVGIGLALRHDPETPVRAVLGPTSARFEVSF